MSFAAFAVLCVVVVGLGVYGAQLYYTRRRNIDSEMKPDEPGNIPTYEASTRIGQQHMDLPPGMWSDTLLTWPPDLPVATIGPKRVRKTTKKTSTPKTSVKKTVKKATAPKTTTKKTTKKVKA